MPDQTRGIPAVAVYPLDLGVELIDKRRHRQKRDVVVGLSKRLASASAIPKSLRIQSTANPNSNSSSIMVLPRFSICLDAKLVVDVISKGAAQS